MSIAKLLAPCKTSVSQFSPSFIFRAQHLLIWQNRIWLKCSRSSRKGKMRNQRSMQWVEHISTGVSIGMGIGPMDRSRISTNGGAESTGGQRYIHGSGTIVLMHWRGMGKGLLTSCEDYFSCVVWPSSFSYKEDQFKMFCLLLIATRNDDSVVSENQP